jgi:hypothetical protein
MCKEENYDAMVWNCRNVTSNYEPMGWSRVVCYSPVLETTYESFLERIGFWSIPASVSLCVFRRELLTEAALSDVRNFRSKIYSHVSLYAILFKNRKFAFINQDLVLYRTNAYDLSHKDTDHWTNYSSSQGFADKFFWNLGFVEQLQFLAANGSLKKDFLKRSIDIGHFGHRLTLLEHVISLMLEQVENDLMGASKIELSSKDLEALLDYFEEIEPKYLGFILSMRELNRVRNSDKKRALRMLDDLKNSFEKSRSSYPFNRFYHSRLFGFLIYDTPLGWLALPQGIASFLNSNPIPLHLAEMLLGIEFPNLEGQYHADSLAELTNKISKLKISGAQIDALNVFHHATAVYKERNSRATTSLVRQVWNRLPLKVKINLKNYLTK